jgi:hypothetical protein
MRKEGEAAEIQPMSQRRRWMVRAGVETIAAVGLGWGLVGGYEAVVDQNPTTASLLLFSALEVEVTAGIVITKQLTAEEKNKDYLELQRLSNERMGLLGGLHYALAEQNEILTRMGLIASQEEEPETIDIPDVFRDAFDNDDTKDNNSKTTG